MEWTVAKMGQFQLNAAVPGHKGLYVEDIEEQEMAGDVDVTLRVRGLMGANSRRIGLNWKKSAFGWDEATEQIIVRASAALPAYGDALAESANMRFMEASEEDQLDDRWVIQNRSYRGIYATGLVDRKFSTQSNVMAVTNFTWPAPGPGWIGANGEIRQQRPVVTETRKSTTAPDMTLVGTAVAPSSAPSVASFPDLYGSDVRLHYPDGWVMTNADPQELYKGAGLWIISYTYEYIYEESM